MTRAAGQVGPAVGLRSRIPPRLPTLPRKPARGPPRRPSVHCGAWNDERALELSGLVVEVHRGLTRALQRVHGPAGIQLSDVGAVLRLRNSVGGALRMTDLAARTHLSTSGVTKLVDRLIALGWATRTPDPGDRRSLLVRLTADGQVAAERVAAQTAPAVRTTLMEPLGDDVDAFLELLTRVRDVVDPDATADGRRR